DSSGFLKGPTPLLEQYLNAAKYPSYDSVRNVFEQMVAQPWKVLPIIINIFITRINSPGAKYPFESAYENSSTTQIDLSRLKSILKVIAGANDVARPIRVELPVTTATGICFSSWLILSKYELRSHFT